MGRTRAVRLINRCIRDFRSMALYFDHTPLHNYSFKGEPMFTRRVISGCALSCLAAVQLVGLAGCSSNSNTGNLNGNSAVVANGNAKPTVVSSPAGNAAPQAKVNLNTATQADLLRVMPNL